MPPKNRMKVSQCGDYRFVFPFEREEITEGLWWILDRERCRWKTVGSWINDPEYEELPELQSGFVRESLGRDSLADDEEDDEEDEEEYDDLSRELSTLNISGDKRTWFSSFTLPSIMNG